jgi:hypothetical protein
MNSDYWVAEGDDVLVVSHENEVKKDKSESYAGNVLTATYHNRISVRQVP